MRHGDLFRLGSAVLSAGLLLCGPPAGAQDAGKGSGKDPAGDGKGGSGADRKDTRPVSSDDAAKAAIERFERDFATKDLDRRMNSIATLGSTKNDLVTKKLGSLLHNPDVDVRTAAASVLDGQYQNTALAGEILRKALSTEDDADVLICMAQTLGRLLYVTAIPEMGELALKNESPFVKMEVLKSYGKMKDTHALLPILDLWLVNPQGLKEGSGGEEHYDSGASGDSDQKEAEKRYNDKHKNDHHRGAPPAMLKTYIQAIVDNTEKITGERLRTPMELMLWMVKHEADLPYKLPAKVKTVLKEFQDRADKSAKK